MNAFKTLAAAAALLSQVSVTAQANEPATFQAMYPDRDVLNGGAPTPASRLAPVPSAANNAPAAIDGARSRRINSWRQTRRKPVS